MRAVIVAFCSCCRRDPLNGLKYDFSFASKAIYYFYFKRSWETCINSHNIPIRRFVFKHWLANKCDSIKHNNSWSSWKFKKKYISLIHVHLINRASKSGTCWICLWTCCIDDFFTRNTKAIKSLREIYHGLL